MPDLHRPEPEGDRVPSTLLAIDAVLDDQRSILEELRREAKRQRKLLERLVEIEEGRLAAEQAIADLAQALTGPADRLSDLDLMDAHVRKRDGGYAIELPDGSQRDATPEEAARIAGFRRRSKR